MTTKYEAMEAELKDMVRMMDSNEEHGIGSPWYVRACAALTMPDDEPEPVAVPDVDAVMEKVQEFASAWSLVGTLFDAGSGLEEAEALKAELRAMLAAAPATVCKTCNGNGFIGGPSYHEPDEGGEPCPVCARDEVSASAADYEEVLADNRRLVRELDVILNGDGAAKQALLCDIVAQLRRIKDATSDPDDDSAEIWAGMVVPVSDAPKNTINDSDANPETGMIGDEI